MPPVPNLPATLPIYAIEPFEIDEVALVEIAKKVFGFKSCSVDKPFDTLRVSEGHRRVEWDTQSDTLWMADWDYLWNPTVKGPAKAGLAAQGGSFLKDNDLLPKEGGPLDIRITGPMVAGTVFAQLGTAIGAKQRNAPALDVHVSFPVTMTVAGAPTPLQGRGMKWAVTFGPGGEIIGCIAGRYKQAKQIKTSASISFVDATEAATVARAGLLTPQFSFAAFAYERVRDASGGRWLVPVWLSELTLDDRFRMLVRLPASEFSGPFVTRVVPAAIDGAGLGKTTTPMEHWKQRRPCSAAGTWGLQEYGKGDETLHDAMGFREELGQEADWDTSVFYEEENAVEDHWNSSSADFVEQLDIAYYAGHAGDQGWQLREPSHAQLIASNLGPGKTSYGESYLKWIAIAACGSMQDALIEPDQEDALFRWRNAYDGLHGLLGFANTIVPRADFGRTFVRRMREGHTFVQAWLRAARECQSFGHNPAGRDGHATWVCAQWASRNGVASPLQDRLPRFGRVTTAPKPADVISAIWTPV